MSGIDDRLSSAPALCELLDRPVPAILSTVSERQRPQSSVVWTQRRDDSLVMFAEDGSVKLRNLRRNQQVTVVVVDLAHQLSPGVPVYAQMSGLATVHDGEDDLPDELAIAYGNPEGYPFPLREFKTIVVDVDRITGLGPLKSRTMGGWA